MTKLNKYLDLNIVKLFIVGILLMMMVYFLVNLPTPIIPAKENNSMPAIIPTPTAVIVLPTPISTPVVENKIIKVDVDSDWGFYRVRGDNNITDKLNLTLNVGDTIRFINDDSYDWPVFIYGISENPIKLRYNYESTSYTFDQREYYAFKTDSKRNRILRVIVK